MRMDSDLNILLGHFPGRFLVYPDDLQDYRYDWIVSPNHYE